MNIIRQAMKSILTTCLPRESLLVRGPRSTSRRPRLALSFDDGPHPIYTPLLLDLLDELNLHATFFVIGKNAEEHPELIRRMAREGHDVGNHTYSHSDPRSTSAKEFLDEVRHCDQLLESLTGRIPSMVRPPKGELNWAKMRGLWHHRKTVSLWNVDPKDYRMNSRTQMDRWVQTYSPCDGDILLFHDNHPFAAHAVRAMASKGIFDRFAAATIRQFVTPANRPVLESVGA